MENEGKKLKDFIAFDRLEPIERAQLLHFYPQLREKTLEQIIKEKGGER